MRALARWRPWHVALACAGWLLGAPLLVTAGVVVAVRAIEALRPESVAGMTVVLTGWSAAAGYALPPVILVAAWLRARSASPRAPGVGPTAPRAG
jgi:hypothetical protein